VRYSRDYYSAFFGALLNRLQGREASSNSTALLAHYFDEEEDAAQSSGNDVEEASAPLRIHLNKLVECLLAPAATRQRIDEFAWQRGQQEEKQQELSSPVNNVSTYSFQSDALSVVASLYPSSTAFLHGQPRAMTIDEWVPVLRALLTRTSETAWRIVQGGQSAAAVVEASNRLFLRALHVLSLLVCHGRLLDEQVDALRPGDVRDLFEGGFPAQPLLTAADRSTYQRVTARSPLERFRFQAQEARYARDEWSTRLYADLTSVLRVHFQACDWRRITDLLHALSLLLRPIHLSHWHTLHPALPFDPLLHTLVTLRLDSLLIDVLLVAVEAQEGPNANSRTAEERAQLAALVNVLVPLLANLVRRGAVELNAHFQLLMSALQVLLLSCLRAFTSSESVADPALTSDVLLCIGCVIRSHGGLQQACAPDKPAVDCMQLTALVHGLLVRVLFSSASKAANHALLQACWFALAQLSFFAPPARTLLFESHLLQLAEHMLGASSVAQAADSSQSTLWLLHFIFSTLTDVCNSSDLLARVGFAPRPGLFASPLGSATLLPTAKQLSRALDEKGLGLSADVNERAMLQVLVANTLRRFVRSVEPDAAAEEAAATGVHQTSTLDRAFHSHPLVHKLDSSNPATGGSYTCSLCRRSSIKGEGWHCLHADCNAIGRKTPPYAECAACWSLATGKSASALQRHLPQQLADACKQQGLTWLSQAQTEGDSQRPLTFPISEAGGGINSAPDGESRSLLPSAVFTSALMRHSTALQSMSAAAVAPFLAAPALSSLSSVPSGDAAVLALRAAAAACATGGAARRARPASSSPSVHLHHLSRWSGATWSAAQTDGAGAVCSQCRSEVAPSSSVFACLPCAQVECVRCYLAHSALEQAHVHALIPIDAEDSEQAQAQCSVCSTSLSSVLSAAAAASASSSVVPSSNVRCRHRGCVWVECSSCVRARASSAAAAASARAREQSAARVSLEQLQSEEAIFQRKAAEQQAMAVLLTEADDDTNEE
jgi:hypothetical protein